MARLSGATLTESQKQAVIYYDAVEIRLKDSGGTVQYYRLTQAPFDIGIYKSFGQLLNIESIEENAVFEIPSLKITVSGIEAYDNSDEHFASDIITSQYIGQPVQIYRYFYNTEGTQVGNFKIFQGEISSAVIVADTKTATVDIEVASHWVDFDRENGRFTNENSLQSESAHSADQGFKYAKDVQKEIEWKP